LIWLLQGNRVVAITEATAAIETETGAKLIYRQFNKLALGPLSGNMLSGKLAALSEIGWLFNAAARY
jgi:hypothetical protein